MPSSESPEPARRPPDCKRELVLVGIDIGQQADPTAVCAIERWRRHGEVDDGEVADAKRRGIVPTGRDRAGWKVLERWYEVRYLERLPLGTPYPRQVEHIVGVVSDPELRFRDQPPWCIVDATGVGRAVLDMLRAAGLHTTGIVITGAAFPGEPGSEITVPAKDLTAVVQVLLQTDRLRVAEDLPLANDLAAEMQAFSVKLNQDTGHSSFAADRGHDDLVMALAVALWYGETRIQSYLPSDWASYKR